MRFLIEAVYCMTWIWTLHRAHNQWKSPMEEDNVWATSKAAPTLNGICISKNHNVHCYMLMNNSKIMDNLIYLNYF